MIHPSKVVSIHPYFKVKAGNWPEAKAALPEFAAKTSTEKGNLYYDFTISGDVIFCREAYVGAEGLLAHVQNVGAILAEFLKLVDIVRIEVHGSAEELAKLKAPLADLKPQWFEFESGVVSHFPALA
jgi:quinol monooxygenase YgiN